MTAKKIRELCLKDAARRKAEKAEEWGPEPRTRTIVELKTGKVCKQCERRRDLLAEHYDTTRDDQGLRPGCDACDDKGRI